MKNRLTESVAAALRELVEQVAREDDGNYFAGARVESIRVARGKNRGPAGVSVRLASGFAFEFAVREVPHV